MNRCLILLVLGLTLTGCAAMKDGNVAPDYVGPKARIVDTAQADGSSGATFFIVARIDDERVENAAGKTFQATYGQGFAMQTRSHWRDVMAMKKTRFTLEAYQTSAAPIQALFRQVSGNLAKSAKGEIEFVPLAGERYEVTGEIRNGQLYVWMRDRAGIRVTPIIGEEK